MDDRKKNNTSRAPVPITRYSGMRSFSMHVVFAELVRGPRFVVAGSPGKCR